MALDLGGMPQLFPHSKEFDQGQGNIRKGAGTFIVADDGSGDFDNIQDAINALPSTGGEIFIKEGTYLIDTSKKININKSNVTLTGTGDGTILKCITDNMSSLIYTTNNPSGISVSNLKIDGDEKLNKAIYFYNVNNGKIFNVTAIKARNTAGGGIDIDSDNDNYANNRIINCYVEEFRPCFNIAAPNTIISNCAAINSAGSDGISFNYAGRAIISNNVCTGNSSQGINIADSGVNCIVIGNICQNNGTGIRNYGDKSIIMGNNCSDNSNDGLEIHATSDRSVVVGNIIYNNTVANLTDGGTNTDLGHNIII